jgi:hypothetical protein
VRFRRGAHHGQGQEGPAPQAERSGVHDGPMYPSPRVHAKMSPAHAGLAQC